MTASYLSAQAIGLFKSAEYKLIDDKVVKFSDVVVHWFSMGDVEDPDLYAGQPLYEWQQTPTGQWVMEHAVDTPFWHRQADPHTFGWKYYIIARLCEADELFWKLKWAKS